MTDQLRYAELERFARQPEVTGVAAQVLGHGEVGVEVVHLRHHANARAHAPGLARDDMAQHPQVSCIGTGHAKQHA